MWQKKESSIGEVAWCFTGGRPTLYIKTETQIIRKMCFKQTTSHALYNKINIFKKIDAALPMQIDMKTAQKFSCLQFLLSGISKCTTLI